MSYLDCITSISKKQCHTLIVLEVYPAKSRNVIVLLAYPTNNCHALIVLLAYSTQISYHIVLVYPANNVIAWLFNNIFINVIPWLSNYISDVQCHTVVLLHIQQTMSYRVLLVYPAENVISWLFYYIFNKGCHAVIVLLVCIQQTMPYCDCLTTISNKQCHTSTLIVIHIYP